MSYSVWMIPAENEVQEYLAGVVERLAEEYTGPKFEPHMTLVGDVELPWEKMEEKTNQLAGRLEPFEVTTSEVSYSTTYYQCVFVRGKAMPELMEAYVTAREEYGLGSGVYMPHISLLYGDLGFEQREDIVRRLKFEKQQFRVNNLVITPGGEHPADAWEHLAEIPLVGTGR